MDHNRRDIAELKQEIKAISHHRNVLKEAIDKMENQLKLQAQATADAESRVGHYPKLPADEETLRKQLARYRLRAVAVEEMAAVYKTGIFALYADGSSYNAAQYNNLLQSKDKMINPGWIETEVSLLKRLFEEEIRLLDGERIELRSKLKQSSTFISELRKRFEENLKHLYRFRTTRLVCRI